MKDSRSSRGKIEVLPDPKSDGGFLFTILLDNELEMTKRGYGLPGPAKQAATLTAKHYGIDISPKRKMKRRGSIYEQRKIS